VLAGSPARLEHARALADLGEILHHAGECEQARATLREALELANRSGAAALEASVLELLRATGARPRRARLSGPEALTPSERRVARIPAQGLSNREIAQPLFVTIRTVEFHPRGAYQKQHIEGRRELPAALKDRPL
jgi:DNA-binding NarL/FixJ family response regulator